MEETIRTAKLECAAALESFWFVPDWRANSLTKDVVAKQRSANRDGSEHACGGAKVSK